MENQLIAVLTLCCLMSLVALASADDASNGTDQELFADLAQFQGSWELIHGSRENAPPNTRSVKTVKGNTETLRRYDIQSGTLKHEHSVEFKLSKSGDVRIFTFYGIGGTPESGLSYVYKLDKDDFYDIPGLLHGDKYRNYQSQPKIWHWKRIVDDEVDEQLDGSAAGDSSE